MTRSGITRSGIASLGAALVLALGLSLAACGGGSEAPTQGTGKGTVAGVSVEKQEITLDHGEIPGVMGAMVMTFSVSDPKVLEGVSPGAKVEFDVEVRDGEYFVTGVRPR
ncbi:MAG: copper-binding protein [Proteobacteria bacterium]|nr:MAG: copper-binding protein [Pseudomonadota bacterium]